jgi:hypothetical protein
MERVYNPQNVINISTHTHTHTILASTELDGFCTTFYHLKRKEYYKNMELTDSSLSHTNFNSIITE